MKKSWSPAVGGLWLALTVSQIAFGAQEPKAKSVDTVLTQTTVTVQESNIKDPDAALASTAFTYQGQLKDANGPVNGAFDFQFTLYSAQSGGEPLGVSEMENVSLTNGMFSFKLDFGRAAVDAKESWLEIGVRPSGSAEDYTVLFPRQKLTPTPYAIFAQHEQWSLIGVPVGFADRSLITRSLDTEGMTPPEKPTQGQGKEAAAAGIANYIAKFDGNGAPTANSIMFDNGTNVGIGTSAPGHRLSIAGGPVWTSNGWKGAVELESSSAIAWKANAAGQRFGLGHTAGGFFVFRTASNPGTAASPALYDFMVSDSGNVGIGTTSPTSKVEIAAQDGLKISGYQPFLTLQDANANNRRGYIQGVDGHVVFIPHSFAGRGMAMVIRSETGNVGIGTWTPQARLEVVGRTITNVLQITGGNFDFSEEFAVTAAPDSDSTVALEQVLPGMVVRIDEQNPGQLIVSRQAYDRRVAGIISGAGGIKPGLLMSQSSSLAEGSYPVALTGRVYCLVDASYGPIEPGDLLTTSDTPGHAMKVKNHKKAQGAIIGKAMTSLKTGKGLVLVLVTLQ
jgi:hypothetical protein